MNFYRLHNLIKALQLHSWNAVAGRTKEIFKGFLCKSKPIPNLIVEESKATTHYLSIVAIVKNEALYIQEWIEYHLLIGVEHFYIYDNDSNDNLRLLLDSYISRGIVTYIFCPGKTMQMPAYNDALIRFGKYNHWIAFIDADEFITLKCSNSLSEFIREYDNYAELGINWCMFDCNNHMTKPQQGFVIQNYTRCFENDNHPLNRHLKCIVKPSSVKVCLTPHYMRLNRNSKAVNEIFENLVTPFPPNASLNRIQINHYFSKSKEEYIEKISRGRSDIAAKRSFDKKSFDFSYEKTKESTILLPFVERLKKIIPETYG